MTPAEIIARTIESQAWAALGTGDTLAYKNRRTSSMRKADRILANLTSAGFRILPPGSLDRDTLEAAAVRAFDAAMYSGCPVEFIAQEISDAIRSLSEERA